MFPSWREAAAAAAEGEKVKGKGVGARPWRKRRARRARRRAELGRTMRTLPAEWRNSWLVISFFMSPPVLSTHANCCTTCPKLS